MMQNLEAMCSSNVAFILETHMIDPRDLHIVLLQLRIHEQELELRQAYEHVGASKSL
jgi:hypothetical protein